MISGSIIYNIHIYINTMDHQYIFHMPFNTINPFNQLPYMVYHHQLNEIYHDIP